MKLNGINVDEQFLLSELSEWEGKLSVLAQRIAEKYNMSNSFTSVENVRKVLSKMRKSIKVEKDIYPVSLDFKFNVPNKPIKLHFYSGAKIEVSYEEAFKYPATVISSVTIECPLKRSDIEKLEAHFKCCNVNYPFDYIAEKDMFPPFEGEKTGFSRQGSTNSLRNFPDFEEQVKRVSKPLPIVYLVIADPHFPAVHIDYFNHCVAIKKKYTTVADALYGEGKWELKVVFIGDILSHQALSYHEHNPDLPSAGDELVESRVHIYKWYREFPNAFITVGNHDLLPYRKAFTAGIPVAYMRDLREVLNTPSWTFCDEIEDNQYGLLFTHGTKLSRNTIKLRCLKKQMSVIAGHLHSELYIEYLTQHLFVMRIGCGQDNTHPESNYNKGGHTEPLMNVSVIFDGKPILEPMEEV